MPSDCKAIAGDHDFKVVSLTPSVALRVDVKPDEGEDGTSYYRGKTHMKYYKYHAYFMVSIMLFSPITMSQVKQT